MLEVVLGVLTLIGSLGVFLYGMKLMSESLQKVAGDKMRDLLAAMTSNRFKRILTGLAITAVIQSSSATTVMVVSFVNAGLLTLVQAVGVIMGANIGTTVTAWIIALFGFKMDIALITLPLIGIAVPLLFSKHPNRRSKGELILGFSLIFLGLEYLKANMPNLQEYPQVLEMLRGFTSYGFFSVLIFLGVGTLMTCIVQSSSATVALTLIMCSNGWIDFPMAAAMILGENIGTTITAILASSVGNVAAKRAALFHMLFNVFGVCWVLILFKPFLAGVAWLTGLNGLDLQTNPTDATPFALSLFHTCFNVSNTLVMVWFTPQLVKIVTRLLPVREKSDEDERLRPITIGMLQTGELSLLQAKKETVVYAQRTYRMLNFVKNMMEAASERELKKIFERIEKYEEISDRVEIEISTYLGKINSSDLSEEGSATMQGLLKVIDDIENVADYCHNIGKLLMHKHRDGVWFNEYIVSHIQQMFSYVDNAFAAMLRNLSGDFDHVDLETAYACEDTINKYRNDLKAVHITNMERELYSYQAGAFYLDILSQCERLGDSLINISEDIVEIRNPQLKVQEIRYVQPENALEA